MKKLYLRPLYERDILQWARIHREITGKWPTSTSGGIISDMFETWASVDRGLRDGLRGLPGGCSLAQFLAEHCGVRNIHGLSPLTIEKILEWVDDHRRRTGSLPSKESGKIADSGGETWSSVDFALRKGRRGMPAGSSLARFLVENRGQRHRKQLPPLTEQLILTWADLYFERTGQWPGPRSGPIPDAPGETWMAVEMALRHGHRSLAGGSSLTLLLADQRGAANHWNRPNLTIEQILSWADAHHARTGSWPNLNSGDISEAPGENWAGVNRALKRGLRGLPGGVSLAELLVRERAVRNRVSVPPLRLKNILAWAMAHGRRTGTYPTKDSGPILDSPGDTWKAIDMALRKGLRGLGGGSSLPRLLAAHGKKRNHHGLPPLSRRKILEWADAHRARTSNWPNINSGPVPEAPGETWKAIDNALRTGARGLPDGSSLHRLLVKKRGLRDIIHLPPLTVEQILHWADLHLGRTGALPAYNSGPIADAPGETWAGIDYALRNGKRGLPGGGSLAKLLKARPGAVAGSAAVTEDPAQPEQSCCVAV